MTASRTDTSDQRILSVATDHVRRFGIARTTIVGIAQEAGMTHANVYRYFASKTALADALTSAWLKPVEALIAQVADSPDPADDKLERLLLALMRAHRTQLTTDANIYALLTDAYAENRVVARNHRARIRLLIERIIEEGVTTEAFSIRGRDRALGLIFDLLYRFLNPHPVEQDRDIPSRTLELRQAAAVRSALLALKAGLA